MNQEPLPAQGPVDGRVMRHTPGPWRWEINRQSKVLHLVGGRPLYDLTIMDFDRWGMGRAVATLRDTSEDGMNIMHRLCDRTDWIAPFPGRDHHANWCADVTHPDMRLMAAAPDLAAALQALYERYVMAIGNEGPETLAARAALEKAGFETYNAEVTGRASAACEGPR